MVGGVWWEVLVLRVGAAVDRKTSFETREAWVVVGFLEAAVEGRAGE